MNSPAMNKFEAVTKAALKTVICDCESTSAHAQFTETAEGLIIQAADQLLLESAVELSETTVNAVCGILLHVYQTGANPGQGANPLLNELVKVLLAARKETPSVDYSTEDPY